MAKLLKKQRSLTEPNVRKDLGKTPALIAAEEDGGNTLTIISYWRSLEDLHAFARSEAHRAGWDWFNREQKKCPHIGIQHETYLAPKGHWENIAHNFRPFGIRKPPSCSLRFPQLQSSNHFFSTEIQVRLSMWCVKRLAMLITT